MVNLIENVLILINLFYRFLLPILLLGFDYHKKLNLYNDEVNNVNSLFEFQKHLLKNIQRRKNKMSTVNKRLSITKRQNTFFNVIYSLKEKMKGKYIKEFNEIN